MGAKNVELDKKVSSVYASTKALQESIKSQQQQQEADMAQLRLKVVALSAALATFTAAAPAQAADLLPPPRAPHVVVAPPPRVVERIDNCAYVIADVRGYSGQPVFRVTVVNGNNQPMTFPVPLKNGRICISRQWFLQASVVQICLGQGPTASRLIRNQWMVIARRNLEHGDVVNPGQPMVWRYEGPIQRRGVEMEGPVYRHHFPPHRRWNRGAGIPAPLVLGALASMVSHIH